MKLITIQLCVGDTFAALHQLLDHAVDTRAIKAWDIVEGGDNSGTATPSTPVAATTAAKAKRKWTRRTPKPDSNPADVQRCGTTVKRETKDGTLEVRK